MPLDWSYWNADQLWLPPMKPLPSVSVTVTVPAA